MKKYIEIINIVEEFTKDCNSYIDYISFISKQESKNKLLDNTTNRLLLDKLYKELIDKIYTSTYSITDKELLVLYAQEYCSRINAYNSKLFKRIVEIHKSFNDSLNHHSRAVIEDNCEIDSSGVSVTAVNSVSHSLTKRGVMYTWEQNGVLFNITVDWESGDFLISSGNLSVEDTFLNIYHRTDFCLWDNTYQALNIYGDNAIKYYNYLDIEIYDTHIWTIKNGSPFKEINVPRAYIIISNEDFRRDFDYFRERNPAWFIDRVLVDKYTHTRYINPEWSSFLDKLQKK